jgi:photosystem II stability/assembly factor-like uncharacterized protein
MIRFLSTNIILLFLCNAAIAQYKIELLDSNTFELGDGVVLSKTSFRGLSVVDDQTIWVSGSTGTFARSLDGGKSFEFKQLKGYEKSDFRDIEAFDDKRAIMMSSGTPAYILKTIDGGQTWNEKYKNLDTAYFLDAMDFWDEKRGILVGDPIHGHFVLLQTKDTGETWQELDTNLTPKAMEGEAVFAASGTSLRCFGDYGKVAFVTGGKYSRVTGANLNRKYIHWKSFQTNINQGAASQGAFSFANNNSAEVIVGGDYKIDTLVFHNSCVKYLPPSISGETFDKNTNDVKGYRSCVEAINLNSFIACGTSGADIYQNKIWKNISNHSFNVVRKAKKGKTVFLAGGIGRIGRLVY